MSNVILGSDGIAIRQGIYEEKVSQMTDLGRFVEFQDGRRFRYCKADGETLLGHMCQSPIIVANQKEQVQTDYGLSIGDKDNISVLLGAAPGANAYADGFLLCNKGTGYGQVHRIRKNTNAYEPCKVWLYDEVITAVPVESELTLVKNKYLDVITSPVLASSSGVPIGVPLITITDNYFFWAQTRGYCALMVDTSAVGVGDPVGPGVTTAGSCKGRAGYSTPTYGVCMYPATVNEYAIINLQLE